MNGEEAKVKPRPAMRMATVRRWLRIGGSIEGRTGSGEQGKYRTVTAQVLLTAALVIAGEPLPSGLDQVVTRAVGERVSSTCGISHTLAVAARDAAGNVSSRPLISGLTPACEGSPCTQTISSGIATAVGHASPGAVICLTAGDYGALQLDGISKSGMVVVRPAPGATVTVGPIGYSNSQNITLTGGGGTLQIAGISGDGAGSGSHHMAFTYATFTSGSTIYARGTNQVILFDHDTFNNLGTSVYEGRLSVVCQDCTASPVGIAISNSHFGNGGCSDGVFVGGGGVNRNLYGLQIGPGDEFSGFAQGDCGPHVDPIQFYGTSHTLVTGDFFHDNGDSSGGVMAFDGADHDTVTNSVFEGSTYAFSVALEACDGCTATHNVILSNNLDFGHKTGDPTSTNGIARDNVFAAGAKLSGGDLANVTESYNLCQGGARSPGRRPRGHRRVRTVGPNSCKSSTDIHTNSPVFVGGSNPLSFTSYAQYALAPTSPGYHAGSDGKSIGITR